MLESYLKVLSYIAKNGPCIKYRIEKALGLSHGTVYNAVKELNKNGYLKGVKEERTRTGLPMITYGLTLKGLELAFMEGQPSHDMAQVAEKWRHLLPLILGKWSYFVSVGLKEELTKAFIWMAKWGRGTEIMHMEDFFNYIFNIRTPATKIKWIKAIRGDSELKRWATATMELWLAVRREWIKIHERTLQLMEVSQEPNWQEEIGNLRWHPPLKEAHKEEEALKR
jgi:DNA-binding Lrp family transcriptional regulator